MKNKKTAKAASGQSDSFQEIKQVFKDHFPADIAESIAKLVIENSMPEEPQKPNKKEKTFHTALFMKDE